MNLPDVTGRLKNWWRGHDGRSTGEKISDLWVLVVASSAVIADGVVLLTALRKLAGFSGWDISLGTAIWALVASMFAIIIAPVSDSIATAFTQGVRAARRHREREITVTRFQDIWQSLAWAEDEAGLLKSAIDAFYGQRPYSVKAEHYPGNAGGEITLELLTRPDLLHWTRRVGDTIDYLRAALNYAAYQIALTDCPSKAGSVEFPIFNDLATFQAKNKVKDFDAARLGLIESAQPYPGRAQELWWLHELTRFHRHRLIRPVIDVAGEFMDSYMLISGSLDDITAERVPFTPAQPGTFLIGRWHNANPAVTQVDVKPNLAVYIVVDDPLVKHEPLPALLFRMSNATREILTSLEKTLP